MNATPERPSAARDPEQLERTADQIRADLDRTLDALERKLSPSQLLDHALAYVRDHGGDLTRSLGDATRGIGDAVRRNPVPIMLTVAGIGWLVASSLRSRGTVDDTFGDESPYADRPVRHGKLHDRVEATRERIHASRTAAANRFARAADTTREQTRRAQSRMASVIEDRPVLLGGLAVAIGALIGAIVPPTEYEDRTVGQVRDRAMERAKQMGERQYQNLRSRLETHRDLEVSGQAH